MNSLRLRHKLQTYTRRVSFSTSLLRCSGGSGGVAGHRFYSGTNSRRENLSKNGSKGNSTPGLPHDLQVNASRLWADLHHTCQWGTGLRWGEKPHETGMSRLTLTDADKEVRDWFVDTTRELGCKVTVDAMGNIFAVRPGRQDAPPTYVGSHLDTQPTGGRYDGILGILAGIEMLKVLKENKIETQFPVGVINWTNEEGARFPISMCSSGVWAGHIPLETAYGLKDVSGDGRTMKDELERIGYLGKVPASHQASPIGAHFELHIEQGPVLEAQGLKIGVVTGVQAYKWYDIQVYGRDCHTGTTPLNSRLDALLLASKLVERANASARSTETGLASVGIMKTYPGSTNTVPGKVFFTLDVRDRTDESLSRLDQSVFQSFDTVIRDHNGEFREEAKKRGLKEHELEHLSEFKLEIRVSFESKATHFDAGCVECVNDSASHRFGDSHLQMPSGAGGVSHHPEEYCAPEDCANGAQVLLDSVLRYDAFRHAK